MSGILTNFGTLAATIIGIAMIAYIIFQAVKLISGKEGASVGKLIGGIAGFLVLLIIIGFATTLSGTNPFSGIGSSLGNTISDEGSSIVGG